MYELLFGGFLLLISALFSSMAERRQFEAIREREAALSDILIFNEKTPPAEGGFHQPLLVSGSIVIAVSYFKTFVAAIQGIFGGRISHYEASIEGARRQALIRMREEAQAHGARMVINVRLETSAIAKQGKKQSVGAVEVLAYGTALK